MFIALIQGDGYDGRQNQHGPTDFFPVAKGQLVNDLSQVVQGPPIDPQNDASKQ
ncbi:hypothetical protein SDC9_193446 [bioreactor metagenome]|uniref:Uncharacterized protein n=1 Tax=bioreactor metagenome TaxID=1076179 RepID=A0A645I3K8_9ZZZZ